MATTAASIVDALVFRPIPVENIEELHRINGNVFNGVLPAPEVRDIMERTDAAAFSYSHRFSVEYALDKNSGLVVLCELMGSAFETLEWSAAKGRLLQLEDYLRGSEPVAVISYAFWQNDLAARSDVVGESLILNGKPFRIVGILPAAYDRLHRTIKPHAFTALVHTFDDWIYDNQGLHSQIMVARLGSQAELPAYQTRLDQAAEYLRNAYPEDSDKRTLTAIPETHAARESAQETVQQSYIIPAWHLARGDSAEALKRGGKAASATVSAKLLVVAQVALCSALLSEAILYTLSLKNSLEFDPVIDGEKLVYFEVSLQSVPIERRQQVARDLRNNLANLPGVESAGFANARPFGGYGSSHINTDRFKASEEEDRCASNYVHVSQDYFSSLGIPLLAGRDVRDGETIWPFEVVSVNESFERRFFPDSSAVGQTFKLWGGDE